MATSETTMTSRHWTITWRPVVASPRVTTGSIGLNEAEIKAVVDDAMGFLSGLEFTLLQGVPQEKLVALRQCVERVFIDRPGGSVTMKLRTVPVGNLQATQEVKLDLPAKQ